MNFHVLERPKLKDKLKICRLEENLCLQMSQSILTKLSLFHKEKSAKLSASIYEKFVFFLIDLGGI